MDCLPCLPCPVCPARIPNPCHRSLPRIESLIHYTHEINTRFTTTGYCEKTGSEGEGERCSVRRRSHFLVLPHLVHPQKFFLSTAQFNAQSSVSRTPRLNNSAWHSTRVGHSSTCLRGIANTSSFGNHPFLRICTTAGRMNSNSSTPAPPPIAVHVGAEVPVTTW